MIDRIYLWDYRSNTKLVLRIREYFYVANPRLNYGPVSVHTLFGGDHLSGSALGFSASQDDFADILGGPSVTQNNFRLSGGIVFKLGKLR